MNPTIFWYQWLVVIAGICCVLAFSGKFWKLLHKGTPHDLSRPARDTAGGVRYAFTTAMLPEHKESAYLHLPTYIAGVLYHIGIALSFVAFAWILVSWRFPVSLPAMAGEIAGGILLITTTCGFLILLKRIFSAEMRFLSTPDDYVSNGLVTAMQLLTALYLLSVPVLLPYSLVMTLLLLWLPFGKTKHVLYFFFARWHLGYFYGRRGTWPVPKNCTYEND